MHKNHKTEAISSINPNVDKLKELQEKQSKFSLWKSIFQIASFVLIIALLFLVANYFALGDLIKNNIPKSTSKPPLIVLDPRVKIIKPTITPTTLDTNTYLNKEYKFKLKYSQEYLYTEELIDDIYKVSFTVKEGNTPTPGFYIEVSSGNLQSKISEKKNLINSVNGSILETKDFLIDSRHGTDITYTLNNFKLHYIVISFSNSVYVLNVPDHILNNVSSNFKFLLDTDLKNLAETCVVAGCNKELCVDKSKADQIYSACVYKNQYACYVNAECTVQKNSSCGWTETSDLKTCLDAKK
ncbi:hypothetical protein COV24_01235 [candidate division WWE3 bacterium CG10_big_fil_rev_8_21_14_0_10_32_10]|uniref:Uncharacterized protein n=1 Tax=candidate division WWE3 bacterium CG10_big_fil_rev_8_21_14_0_10_32_10 TaxID=1975090 RepID=A0A2H0RAV2_UNCKA|nr:MAG: hypothetical protein COV24_01235 [candidate division WWE3 bacterium CG10_big_fil_rev_8_21_14_0_10_32_10]